MKKKTNITSVLGLSVELAAVLVMATSYFRAGVIPKPACYMFIAGLLICIAGAGISRRENKK